MTPQELQSALAGFTGSDTLTRHGLTRRILMTQGVVFLAEQAQAHWLTDLIVSHQADPRVRSEPFQVWTLSRRRRDLQRRRYHDRRQLHSSPLPEQEIPWTDFPLPEVTLWLVRRAMHGYAAARRVLTHGSQRRLRR